MYCPKNQRLAQTPCGSGLAREGGVSVTESSTEPPLSQASQLPHWPCIAHRISAWHRSPVGAGLPAKAVCQSLNIQLNHRFRRQASSHIGFVLPKESAPGTDLVCARWQPDSRTAGWIRQPIHQSHYPVASFLDYWLRVTRQTVLAKSSAMISAPLGSTVTPTGRPRVLPSSPRKPVAKSMGSPAGLPLLNGTKITL